MLYKYLTCESQFYVQFSFWEEIQLYSHWQVIMCEIEDKTNKFFCSPNCNCWYDAGWFKSWESQIFDTQGHHYRYLTIPLRKLILALNLFEVTSVLSIQLVPSEKSSSARKKSSPHFRFHLNYTWRTTICLKLPQ